MSDESKAIQYSTSQFLVTCSGFAIAAGLFVMNYLEVRGSAEHTDFFRTVSIVHYYQSLWLWLLIGSVSASFFVPSSLRFPVRVFCILAFCGLLYNVFLGLGTL